MICAWWEGRVVDEMLSKYLEVVEPDVDRGEGSGTDEHVAQIPHARREWEGVECVVTDLHLASSHGTKSLSDR